ncbi:hypothetical protein F6Q07_21850 [Pectobacterium parmentieri]|uniref:hypothetical protein n=1 Tax=Pectobacterium parmentieri TaxID=1905730 RepID=UPI0001B0B7CD|nr:hypothetical protein [Pectobacterium parmentieri]ACX88186.1 conserved hypothetical protein [Pectobacterium parmentieri WPP163]AYH01625.1 hypothetical protein C5E26_12100 [Pectobacterium parmentieri]AYH27892.1 hypothetical protein C5E20_12505 [Pectobacterium parmentieri]AYH32198.1 hypothetical protein C5E19_11535 [Pectobacterium parmentieri]MBI0520724.1 hypothetical protein [Pectobacterium parmentieri]
MKRVVFPLTLLTLSVMGSVQAESLQESLLHCDNRFFSELYVQQKAFIGSALLKTDSQHRAWFVPPKNGGDVTWFSQPVKSGNLVLSGYFMRQNDLEAMGKYYFWGLIIDSSAAEVAAALSKVNWQKAGDEYFANPMIKRPGDQMWKLNSGAASGIAPAKGSVEKLALLSDSGDKAQLLCSVQGNVTDEILLSLRPDLIGSEK